MIGKRPEVQIIQQLRGLAAMLVVLYHACAPIGWLYLPFTPPHFGMGGVDLFFVISGFVMYIAARGEGVGEFLYKRVTRIAPLYWIVTLLFAAMRFRHFGEPDLTIGTIVRSLLFIPYRATPDGQVWPVLVPGWTLEIELAFYLAFAAGLLVRRPALVSTALIVAAVLIGLVFDPQQPAAKLFTQPIMVEFSFGLWLGRLWTRGAPPAACWPLAPLGAVLLCGSDLLGDGAEAARAVAALLIMPGALALEIRGKVPRPRLFKALGDASYSIYLIHTPVLLAFRPAFARLPIHGPAQLILFLLSAAAASALAGWVLHRMLERPLIRLFRRWAPGPRRRAELVGA